MILPGVNGALSSVGMVVMWGNILNADARGLVSTVSLKEF